jgi:murein L,D-transpeptidase YafK
MKKIAFILYVLLFSNILFAQNKLKIVTYDSKGNIVEDKSTFIPTKETPLPSKIVKDKDGKSVVQTKIVLGKVLNNPFNIDTIDINQIDITVIKSHSRIYVYHKNKFLTAYKCVFGQNPVGQKLQEGDKKTPEGEFTITGITPHKEWSMFMKLDYPCAESIANFESAKATGKIPGSARIGGNVGIHGVWAGGDDIIDAKHNWTDGCIALKNKDLKEFSQLIHVGTKIKILASK